MSDALVYALGVAVSPVPTGAVILVLTCPARVRGGLSFLAGWVAGLALLAVLFVALVSVAGISDTSPVWIGVLEVLVGTAFLVAAAVVWIRRGRRGVGTRPWVDAVDRLTAAGAGGLGVVLSGANPKVAALALGAVLSTAQADAGAGTVTAGALAFVAVGALGVVAPVAAHVAAPARTAVALHRLRAWLETHEATVLGLLGAALGLVFVREGLISL